MSAIVVGASLYAFAMLSKAAVGYETKVRYDEPTRHVVIEQNQPAPPLTNQIDLTQFPEAERMFEQNPNQYPKPIDTYPYKRD